MAGELAGLRRELAARARMSVPGYRLAHWGHGGDYSRVGGVAADPSRDKLVMLGELAVVGYWTHKLGDGPSLYVHAFHEPYPALAYSDPGGLLAILGGAYRMTTRGIVG